MNRFSEVVSGLLLVSVLLPAGVSGQQDATSPGVLPEPAPSDWFASEEGRFRIRYISEMEPIVINRMHSWVLHVETDAGTPVDEAEFVIEGGMPAHDHGLATEPVILPTNEPGVYRITGLRFHMPGEWVLELEIDAGHTSDRVTVELSL